MSAYLNIKKKLSVQCLFGCSVSEPEHKMEWSECSDAPGFRLSKSVFLDRTQVLDKRDFILEKQIARHFVQYNTMNVLIPPFFSMLLK